MRRSDSRLKTHDSRPDQPHAALVFRISTTH
jgi:hypothetical protein